MNPHPGTSRSRRQATRRIALLSASALGLSGCSRAARAERVVLYSSVDEDVIRPLLPLLSEQAGANVALVGDSEATKTFGLVKRLEA